MSRKRTFAISSSIFFFTSAGILPLSRHIRHCETLNKALDRRDQTRRSKNIALAARSVRSGCSKKGCETAFGEKRHQSVFIRHLFFEHFKISPWRTHYHLLVDHTTVGGAMTDLPTVTKPTARTRRAFRFSLRPFRSTGRGVSRAVRHSFDGVAFIHFFIHRRGNLRSFKDP